MVNHEEALRRLTVGDERYLDSRIMDRRATRDRDRLDHHEEALLKLGAISASGGPDQTFQQVVGAALDSGLSAAKVVDALIVLAPLIGSARVVAIAPQIALGIGYDIDKALDAH